MSANHSVAVQPQHRDARTPKGGSAVMASRIDPLDVLDFFPTPLWGTRALVEYVLGRNTVRDCTVWEPACGQGHMSRALAEYFREVFSSDIYDYGYGHVGDFLDATFGSWRPPEQPDWIITNPPFKSACEFARQALAEAKHGVALLCRIQWGEGRERERLFEEFPLTFTAPFMGRLPMFKGRLDRKAASATAYAWFVWRKPLGLASEETVRRIPTRAKSLLDRESDWH